MQNKRTELSERLLDFTASIIRLVAKLNRTTTGKHISGQLTRSATSAGANYEETCGAESRADFVHKMQIVLKELNESVYWLKLIARADLLPHDVTLPIMNESAALVRITTKPVITAKNNR